MKNIIAVILLFTAVGCTDAKWDSATSFGRMCHIGLYQEGKCVREWVSTGVVIRDGTHFAFRDRGTKEYVRIGVTNVVVTTLTTEAQAVWDRIEEGKYNKEAQ